MAGFVERRCDLWSLLDTVDAICITTNGAVKTSGCAVMGRGVARQTLDRFPLIARSLGESINRQGNHVAVFDQWNPPFVSFPVKHTWNRPADPDLIVRSVGELIDLTETREWRRVVLPRPGCGNGQLSWETVRPLLARLDKRFLVVSY